MIYRLTLLLLLAASVHAQSVFTNGFRFSSGVTFALAAQTDILAGRYADWVNAGMSGGIPTNNTLYTNLALNAPSSTVQAAIDACPSNQFVLLPAGTNYWSGNVRFQDDGVELQGATNANGWPTSVIIGTNANWGIIDISTTTYPLPPNAANIRNLTGSLAAGATSMTCTSAPTGLTAGMIATVDELDWGTINGGRQGSEARVTNRNHFETFLVTDVTSSTVTFTPPLTAAFDSSHVPQIWWGTGAIPKRSGLRNLILINAAAAFSSGDHNVAIGPAWECYMKNVHCQNIGADGVKSVLAPRTTIQDCWFSNHLSVASASYSIEIIYGGHERIENNIGTDIPCFINLAGTVGAYVGFNITTNTPYSTPTWLPQVWYTHGLHCSDILWENNWVTKFAPDNYHGTSARQNMIRNRILSYDGSDQTDATYFLIEAFNTNMIIAGNVMGTASVHNGYTNDTTPICSFNPTNFPTLIGNYNTVDAAVPSSEALTGSQSISNSYVYLGANRPEHHTSGVWPPFPTTSISTANQRTNLAVGFRLENGRWP